MRDNQRRAVRLDRDGVPIDGRDWTEADWADLHHGMTAIKARIAARHAKAEETSARPKERDA